VDEAIFRRWLKEAGVEVVLRKRIREHSGVEIRDHRILSLTTADGKRWSAKQFADCSYQGDLMAQAGITYTVGRESTRQFGEDLAGVRASTPAHQFTWPISAYDNQHRLLPEIGPGPLGLAGSADRLVQAYNFRLILTNNPTNRLPFSQPPGYDPARFALLRLYLAEFLVHRGRIPVLHDFFNPVLIPNHKADFNNNGPISTDYIGHSWHYPDGSFVEKQQIAADHLVYTQAFVYFLSQDPSVPPSLRDEINQWGLPRDEFMDTGHWPNQLYIREGRRMVGVYVMHQADLQTERTKPDSIGMGSYNSDSHNVERVALADGTVTNEGDVQVPVKPYEIPYRVLLPLESQMQNLLVPVCLSASHIAYSSVRMEPQYMILGQAAGIAAALAIRGNITVQQVSVEELQRDLLAQDAILHWRE